MISDGHIPAEFQSKSAVREVIGCLLQNPSLLTNHKIDKSDFAEPFHKLIFGAVCNLYALGATKLTSAVIDEFLRENNTTYYKIYSNNNGNDYVDKGLAGANLENFEKNYMELRKFSVLRDLRDKGIDVSEIFDPYDVDPEKIDAKRAFFNSLTVDTLIAYFKNKLVETEAAFSPRTARNSVKAGSEAARVQKELWKESPAFGLSYASNYQTTITMGMRPKKFSVSSAGTGTGKNKMPF